MLFVSIIGTIFSLAGSYKLWVTPVYAYYKEIKIQTSAIHKVDYTFDKFDAIEFDPMYPHQFRPIMRGDKNRIRLVKTYSLGEL